ncbi:PAS domain-containing protein, partial [bacterium]|nr:PAS domain-containing protein [bacterium]
MKRIYQNNQGSHIKLLLFFTCIGAMLGYLLLSPFAMFISHYIHADLPYHEMTIFEVFMPSHFLWSAPFTLLSSLGGCVIAFLYLKLQEKTIRLSDAHGFNELLLNSMYEGMLFIDRNYRIQKTNEAFLKSSGLSMDEVIGKHCYEITHGRNTPCDTVDHLCPLVEVLETGNVSNVVHVHFDTNGKKLYFELSASPIKDNDGNVIGIIEVSKNITEKKKADAEIAFKNSLLVAQQEVSPDG